jgi:hypothetical protein
MDAVTYTVTSKGLWPCFLVSFSVEIDMFKGCEDEDAI